MAIDFDVRCDVLVSRFGDYLERQLGPDEAEALEQHLVICEGCSDYVAQLRATMASVRNLRADAAPSAATLARLQQLFAAQRRGEADP